MPKNLESIVRYRVINNALRNRKKQYPTKQELIDACSDALGVREISSRTIEKDLYDMRSNSALGYFAPIKYNAKHNGYFYEDENYSIDNIPLTEEDLETIMFASSVLSQFKGVDVLSGFSNAVDKIADAMHVRKARQGEAEMNFIQFDNPGYIAGGEFLGVLIKATEAQQKVLLKYKKFGKSLEKEYLFSPYFIKEFNSLWFVVGWVEEYGDIRIFALDRFQNVELRDEYFAVSESFDKKSFNENVYGVNRGGLEPQEVVLKFDAKQAHYVKTLPIHSSQKIIKSTEESTVVSLNVVVNPELIMKVLSYGANLEVVKPQVLREKVKEEVKKTLMKY